MYFTDKNESRFEGTIVSAPVLNEQNGYPVLEFCILNKPTQHNLEFTVHLRAYRQYALVLCPQLAKDDKIYVECSYSPQRVLGEGNLIFPKFNVSKVIILQKKLSTFKYEYKESDT